jgi:ribose transport system substrate-binding protein
MRSKLKLGGLGLCAVLMAVLLAACGTSSTGGSSAASQKLPADVQTKVDQCLASVSKKIYNHGPNGETAVPGADLTLTADEIEKVKAKNATVAVAWHVMNSDYSVAQIAGLKDTFKKLGIKVLAITDGEFKVDKQVSDIETLLARKPDYMVSLPVDAPSQEAIYRRAADAGIKLVFALNAPKSFKHGSDYITVVGSDDYGTGVVNACELVRMMGGEGELGLNYHEANYYATRQRYEAMKSTLKQFPDIKVVEEKGNTGPDFTGQAAAAANSMLTAHPNLKAIWAVWDTHAEGTIAAARELGKSPGDFSVGTIDLGKGVAIDMAQGGFIKTVGASRPYDQGVTEAMAVGANLLGKEVAPYYAWNALAVTSANVGDAWEQVYRAKPPSGIKNAGN